MIWRIIFMTFNIPPPQNITNMFENWLHEVPKKDKAHIRVGVCVVLWAIWKVRNDCIFNINKFPIIFIGYPFGYPLDLYVVLSTVEGQVSDYGYWMQPVEMVAQDFFSRWGWRDDRCLTY
jgi:hypothetical protein